MIEQTTINGRQATVAYFDADFNPVEDLSLPHFAKVLFDDGEMVILRSSDQSATEPLDDEDDGEHEHDPEAFGKHRARFQKKTIKIHGQSLATWARAISAQDAERIATAISVGLTAGEDNTDIAHRVIGGRRHNGVNGMTEVTRQHIFSLGKGLLHKRKSRMSGSAPE